MSRLRSALPRCSRDDSRRRSRSPPVACSRGESADSRASGCVEKPRRVALLSVDWRPRPSLSCAPRRRVGSKAPSADIPPARCTDRPARKSRASPTPSAPRLRAAARAAHPTHCPSSAHAEPSIPIPSNAARGTPGIHPPRDSAAPSLTLDLKNRAKARNCRPSLLDIPEHNPWVLPVRRQARRGP